MCTVSMIGDHYSDKWRDNDFVRQQYIGGLAGLQGPSRAEFDALKKEVEEMKALLKRAVEYDKRNNEPHCEMEEKIALLRKVADLVGVDLNDVLGKE